MFCRIRPMTATEGSVGTPIGIPPSEPTDDSEEVCLQVSSSEVTCHLRHLQKSANRVIQLQFERKQDGRKQDHSFTFDRIFAPTSTQQEVHAASLLCFFCSVNEIPP